MQDAKLKTALLAIALLMIPSLALAQPVINSISPTRTTANTGATVNIYGTGFGSLSDLVYFPDSTGPHVVNPVAVIAGGDLMYAGDAFAGRFGHYGPTYIVVGLLYFVMCFPLARLARRLESRSKVA